MSIRTDLTNAEYHALESLSKSQLDDLDRSAYIFWQRHRNENRPPRPEPTPAMMLGTMVHTAVLEPERFASAYVVGPKFDRRTKDGKAAHAAFLEGLAPGAELTDQDTLLKCDGMRLSVGTIPELAELLSKGRAEISAFWTDADTGVECRIRPDWVAPAGDGVLLVDLKTAQSASPSEFVRSIEKYHYETQCAMYSDGWEAATGQKVYGFVFAVVESNGFPYAAAAYMLDDEAIESGRRRYKRLLRTYAECMKTGVWPGYTPDGIQLLSLRKWALEPND